MFCLCFLRVGSLKALAFDFLDKVMAEKLAVGPTNLVGSWLQAAGNRAKKLGLGIGH